jgi:hypothetical protein
MKQHAAYHDGGRPDRRPVKLILENAKDRGDERAIRNLSAHRIQRFLRDRADHLESKKARGYTGTSMKIFHKKSGILKFVTKWVKSKNTASAGQTASGV